MYFRDFNLFWNFNCDAETCRDRTLFCPYGMTRNQYAKIYKIYILLNPPMSQHIFVNVPIIVTKNLLVSILQERSRLLINRYE